MAYTETGCRQAVCLLILSPTPSEFNISLKHLSCVFGYSKKTGKIDELITASLGN